MCVVNNQQPDRLNDYKQGEYTDWFGFHSWECCTVIQHARALTAVNPQHDVRDHSLQKQHQQQQQQQHHQQQQQNIHTKVNLFNCIENYSQSAKSL